MFVRWLIRDARILALLAIIVACSACTAPMSSVGSDENTASTQQAITNGEDDDADPAVVALLSGGKIFCSGALITSNVILTAAHCVTPSPPDQVYFGSRPSPKKGTFIAVVDTKVHPDFDEDSLANDVALVVIETKAPATPLNVFKNDFDKSFVGRPIRLVGFGVKTGGEQSDLRKREGSTTILTYGDDDFRFHPGPSQTCNGDSGGPALATFGDHEAIVGLASSGDADCKDYGRNMRVDRYLPFIQNYAKSYSAKLGAADNKDGCSMTARAPSSSGTAVSGLLLAVACAFIARLRRARSPRV